MDLLRVEGWCWDCPFCGAELVDSGYAVLTLLIDHHLVKHERQLVAVAEAVLRAS